MNGVIGRVFLKLPQSELYLVQWPGFPVVEKVYYASDLEPVDLPWLDAQRSIEQKVG